MEVREVGCGGLIYGDSEGCGKFIIKTIYSKEDFIMES